MTQEGQALPSPTPPENPLESNTAAATADPPVETQRHSQADTQLLARASDDLEEAKQQQEEKEESLEGEEEVHREGEKRGSDEGGEGDVEEEKLDCAGGKNQQTELQVKGESDGTRGDGSADVVEISSSMGEEAAHAQVEKMEGEEEVEEGKDNEERHPPAEAPLQAERWVYYIIFMCCCCSWDVQRF